MQQYSYCVSFFMEQLSSNCKDSLEEYYFVSKTNIGLTYPVDSSFIKENSPPDVQKFYDKIVTETWQLQLLKIIDHKMPLPATVDYYPKSGKTGEAHPELIMQHLRILQMC